MKRRHIAAAPILAAGTLFIQEIETPKCKYESCAIEAASNIPEQPHASEEPPTYDVFTATEVWAGSPPVWISQDSEEGKKWTKMWNDSGYYRKS